MKKGTFTGLVIGLLIAQMGFAEKPERPSGHEQIPGWVTNSLERLDFGVLLEIEGYGANIAGERESDVLVSTVAFDLEAAMNDWLLGHIGLLWEQYSRETDNIDEAYIALGGSESIPYYLVAGRFYQPVGNFESVFISDPLTLELVEMNRTAAMVGYGNEWVDLNVGAFKGNYAGGSEISGGETNAISETTISDYFASITFTPTESLKFGAYWLSNLLDTYNYGNIAEDVTIQPGYEKVGAAGAFVNAYVGRFGFFAEYASALGDYNLGSGSYVPAAYNLEGFYQLTDPVTIGLKFEGSHDLYAAYDRVIAKYGDKYPGQAYGAVVAWAFQEYATVAVEYLHVAELDDDADGNVVTVQLGLEF